jgi:hypothetical protein
MSNGVRGKRHALSDGIAQGVKPADNVLTLLAERNGRATPVAYADERNLRLKRRKYQEVKWLKHLAQNGHDDRPVG